MTEPGDSDPAVECRCDLMLGMRRGRLAAEALERSLPSESIECVEADRWGRGKSVVWMCSPLKMLEAS
jgi:hypothetical protein